MRRILLVGVAEAHLGEGGTTSGIMDEGLDDTLDIPVALSKVESAELGSSFPGPVVGLRMQQGRTLE